MPSKIYLVDDEPVLLWVIKEYLEAHGFSVKSDTDPSAALLDMQRNIPDIAILDVLMPTTDGFSLLEQMRNVPALVDVPVIFLTAIGELPARLRGFQIGADDYVTKPFEMNELEARIKAILRRTKEVLTASAPHLDSVRNSLLVEGQEIFLTPSEALVVAYLLEKQDTLITTEELLRDGLGYADNTGNLATVRYHIRNLRKKLQHANLHTLRIETVGRSGYLLATSGYGAQK